jgi:hypothetical protein
MYIASTAGGVRDVLPAETGEEVQTVSRLLLGEGAKEGEKDEGESHVQGIL